MATRVIDARARGQVLHYRSLVENEYLGQWDLWRDGRKIRPVVEIESIQTYEPPGGRRRKRLPDGRFVDERLNKLVIRFVGKRKGWICGPTSQKEIAAIYGSNVVDWIGKRITLYVDEEVTFGRKRVGGIRVVNAAPREEPTDDALDRPADADLSARLSEVFDGEEQEQEDEANG